MECKYKCGVIFFGINILIALILSIFFKLLGVLNFEVGFFSFFLVLYSTYIGLKKRIQKEIDIHESVDEDNKDNKNKSRFNFSNIILGLELSMGVYRILAYIILVIGIVLLIFNKVFVAPAYIIGIFVCAFSVVGIKFLQERKNNSL